VTPKTGPKPKGNTNVHGSNNNNNTRGFLPSSKEVPTQDMSKLTIKPLTLFQAVSSFNSEHLCFL
jgi:hypothetical protein